jgi:hypothetical protein
VRIANISKLASILIPRRNAQFLTASVPEMHPAEPQATDSIPASPPPASLHLPPQKGQRLASGTVASSRGTASANSSPRQRFEIPAALPGQSLPSPHPFSHHRHPQKGNGNEVPRRVSYLRPFRRQRIHLSELWVSDALFRGTLSNRSRETSA